LVPDMPLSCFVANFSITATALLTSGSILQFFDISRKYNLRVQNGGESRDWWLHLDFTHRANNDWRFLSVKKGAFPPNCFLSVNETGFSLPISIDSRSKPFSIGEPLTIFRVIWHDSPSTWKRRSHLPTLQAITKCSLLQRKKILHS
jgi:hypothetical protein